MTITIDEYQKFCLETFISRDPTTDLLHCIAGMQAEAWEIIEKLENEADQKEVYKEIGGLCYYFAMTCNLTYRSMRRYFNEWFPEPSIALSEERLLTNRSGIIAAATQKFHRGDYDQSEFMDRVGDGMILFIRAISELVDYSELLDILESNKQILLDRKQRGQIKGDGDNR